jgi:hypothetical protein
LTLTFPPFFFAHESHYTPKSARLVAVLATKSAVPAALMDDILAIRPTTVQGFAVQVLAIDADSKLLVSWLVGGRDGGYAIAFMDDLRSRLANRVQLTSDGHKAYLEAVEGAFGGDVDYAQLVKIYGNPPEGEKRHSPAECTGIKKTPIEGNPDPKHISTSYVERQNLTMRMQMRRFMRLTNAFSEKFENRMHMVALHTVWYNFVKLHKAHRMTPAMAAGVTDTLWSMTDLAEMVDASLPKPGPRGPYEKRMVV